MTHFSKNKRRPVTNVASIIAGVLALWGASACSVEAGGDAEGTMEAGEDTATSAEAYTFTSWLPWRGAPQKNLNLPNFGSDRVVYAVDIGTTRVCRGCLPTVTAIQYWWVTSFSTTPQSTVVGKTSGTTGISWNRQVCPANQHASGYRIGVGSNTGRTRIESLGLICTALTSHAGTTMPMIGSYVPLFPEVLNCAGSFTTDPLRYLGDFSMNGEGDGMQGKCVRQ